MKILKEHYATLVIEYVAIRDIQPDEEIFIDYGEEWDEAWVKHTNEFHSSQKGNSSALYSMFNFGTSSSENDSFSSKLLASMNANKLNKQYHNWTNDYFNVCRYVNN